MKIGLCGGAGNDRAYSASVERELVVLSLALFNGIFLAGGVSWVII